MLSFSITKLQQITLQQPNHIRDPQQYYPPGATTAAVIRLQSSLVAAAAVTAASAAVAAAAVMYDRALLVRDLRDISMTTLGINFTFNKWTCKMDGQDSSNVSGASDRGVRWGGGGVVLLSRIPTLCMTPGALCGSHAQGKSHGQSSIKCGWNYKHISKITLVKHMYNLQNQCVYHILNHGLSSVVFLSEKNPT